MKKISLLVTILLMLFFSFFISKSVRGQSGQATVNLKNPMTGICEDSSSCDYDPKNPSIPLIVGNIIQVFLGIAGSLALLAFIIGAVRWLFSRGQQDEIKKGSMTMLYAIIGLTVIFSSYAILSFFFETVT